MSNPISAMMKNINRKEKLLTEEYINEKDVYKPFVINRVMSRTQDGLLVAEDLNRKPDQPKYEQYRHYYHKLSKNLKRFGKKIESDKHKYESIVMEYFGFSLQKARIAITILSDEELEKISKFKGGKQ